MSSLVDTLSSAVDDLTSVVGEVGYSVADSVTEQVTSIINGLRAEDESSKIKKDKPVEGREEHPPSLTGSREVNVKVKRGIAEHEEARGANPLGVVKNHASQEGVSDHVMDKSQCQLKCAGGNNHVSDTEVPQDLKTAGGPFKREAVGRNECSVNYKFLKDSNLESDKFTMEQSLEARGNCLRAVSDNSKNHLHRKIKPQSPGVDFQDSEDVHSVNVAQDLETNLVEVQKQKLSASSLKKMQNNHPHCINEIKEKKSEAFFDREGKPVLKDEDNVSATVSKGGKKNNPKKSERELCNQKTAGKGEESVSKLRSSIFPETSDTSYFFHLFYTFNASASCG